MFSSVLQSHQLNAPLPKSVTSLSIFSPMHRVAACEQRSYNDTYMTTRAFTGQTKPFVYLLKIQQSLVVDNYELHPQFADSWRVRGTLYNSWSRTVALSKSCSQLVSWPTHHSPSTRLVWWVGRVAVTDFPMSRIILTASLVPSMQSVKFYVRNPTCSHFLIITWWHDATMMMPC